MHAIEHTYVSLLADVARLTGLSEIRGSYEGLQWCLVEAPKLEKRVLSCIEDGRELEVDDFPRPLQRLALRSVTDPIQMRYLRQLLLFCYKASVTHDKETTEKAYQNFIGTNHIVGRFGNELGRVSPSLLDDVRRHCQSVLYRVREKAITPSHGPGAVTTCKDRWRNLYSTLEACYPYSDWFTTMYNRDQLDRWDDMDRPDAASAKLIAVPKDSRGPRLICVHPAELIWVQQGLRVELQRAISLHRSAKGPWPQGHIFFNDQSVNGRIALLSSRSRRYATIDMKEASDRISEPLVQILFGRKYKYFGSCRAQEFYIPRGRNGTIKGQLNCYAPMGNATTFPVQSLVFWAICVSALQRLGYHQSGACFVFGDDIIIPTECVEGVIDALESFGLLVNRTKSFWRGGFRESCGVDAFNGVNVTPVRWKTTLDAEHPIGLQSLSDIAQRLRLAGYEEAATMTYQTLRRRLWGRYGQKLFLTNNPDHGGIAEFTRNEPQVWDERINCDDRFRKDRSSAVLFDSYHQWYQTVVWRLEDRKQKRTVHDWNHVLESLCALERKRFPAYGDHSSVRPELALRRVRLNLGWANIV